MRDSLIGSILNLFLNDHQFKSFQDYWEFIRLLILGFCGIS